MEILILGAKGLLGGYLRQEFPQAVCWDKDDADVTDVERLKVKIQGLKTKPDYIINCVAYNDVDGAEKNPEPAFLLNEKVVGNLAQLAKQLDCTLVHFSTNFVFDDEKGEYNESAVPSPKSVYGESKYAGERALIDTVEKYYLVRTAVLYGQQGESELSKRPFVDLMLGLSEKTDTIKAITDEIYSTTYAKDLSDRVAWLLKSKPEFGVYHFVNSGLASWYDLAKEIFIIRDKKINLIPVPGSEFPRPAKRPRKSVLLNTKSPPMRAWQEALRDYLNDK